MELEALLELDMVVVVGVAQEQLEVTEQQLQVEMGVTELHPLYRAHQLPTLVGVGVDVAIILPVPLELPPVLVELAVVVRVLSTQVVLQLPELQILAGVVVAVVHQVPQIQILAAQEVLVGLG